MFARIFSPGGAWLPLLLFISACSTSLKSVPPLDLKVSAEPTDRAPRLLSYRSHINLTNDQLTQTQFKDLAMERWRKHSLALKLLKESKASKKISCPYWQDLSQDETYPLNKVAQIYFTTHCEPVGNSATKKSLELTSEEKSIYDEILAEKLFSESQQTETLEDDVTALLEKAKWTTHFQDRQNLFESALKKAQATKYNLLISTAEAALYKSSPRLNPSPKDSELMAVASDHRLWREFDPALKIYRSILKNKEATSDEKFAAHKAIRQTLKTAERRNEYIEATASLAQWTNDHWKANPKDFSSRKRFHDSQLLLVRTLWTEDRTLEALKTLKRTERWLQGTYPMEEVNFVRSRIFEERKDSEQALSYLQKALDEKTSQKFLREKLLWAQAWLLYKNEKYEEALTPLKELSEKTKDNPEKVRALYWTARAQVKLLKIEESKVTFKHVIKEDPLGFYGLLAIRELGEKITPLQVPESSQNDERLAGLAPAELLPLAILTDWLVAVGETQLAEKSLNRFSERLRQTSYGEEELWLRVFSRYAQTGSYLPLFSNLTLVKAETREAILAAHPEILFPQPFKNLVDEAATKAQVPAPLIYAIMRQESAFNPKARSHMDAYGLMQLMPSVAKIRAKQKNISFEKATELYDPEVNVPLGAFELQNLLLRHKSQFIMAISAYNASEKALKGWVKNRYRLDPIEFIEEIPYEETRSYIKLVLRNYIFYRRFEEKEAFEFPESCLRLGHNTLPSSYLPSQAETVPKDQ